MQPLTLSKVSFALSASLWLGQWICGYNAWLAPFLMLTPFVYLGAAASMLMLFVLALAQLIAGRAPLVQRIACVLVIAAMLPLVFATAPQRLGFRYRVASIPESEWLRLAADARASVGEDRHDLDWNRAHVRQLAHSYAVLRIGDYPPKLFVSDNKISFWWGSGLIGTLGVDIENAPITLGPKDSDGYFDREIVHDHVAIVLD